MVNHDGALTILDVIGPDDVSIFESQVYQAPGNSAQDNLAD